MKRKKWRFPNHTHTVHIPFILNRHGDWDEEISKEMSKITDKYELGKNVLIDYKITATLSEIIISKE